MQAVNVGPNDLLPDITAYKVNFNLNGTISNDVSGDSVVIEAIVLQGASDTFSDAQFFSPPFGTTSFYIQPPDLTDPFDVEFFLVTNVADSYCCPGAPLSATVDYSNTATLESVQAVDGNGDVIPGVLLEAGDGTILGNGAAPPPVVPEPPSWLLFGSGLTLLMVFCLRRRRSVGAVASR